MSTQRSSRHIVIAVVIGATIIALGLVVGLAIGLRGDDDEGEQAKTETFKSAFGTYQYAAVAADAKICSDIGTDIMGRHRGNVVDAGVATLLCIGALSSHSGGLGGGSFGILYFKNKGWQAVDFRESAPSGATADMYAKEEDRAKSVNGGLAIAVPGELKGAHELHVRYGAIPWKTVVDPTMKLFRDGFPLPKATHKALSRITDQMKPSFSMFFDANNNPKPVGSLIKMLKLARTFEIIADDPMSFYNGTLADDIVADIKEAGGIITKADLGNYRALFKTPTQVELPDNMKLYSMPTPGSGPVLAYILSILSGYNMSADSIANDKASVLSYHRIVEAMKFAYSKRSSLGDEDFVDVKSIVHDMVSREYGEETRKNISDSMTHDVAYYKPSFYNEDNSGTSHMSAIDGEGNAISITSTVNHYFGSKVVGNRTGLIFNNEMDDFSTPGVNNYFGLPPSKSNFIVPGKRPMSSMSPAIVWDNDNKRVALVTGAAGGSRITTATALAIIDTLWFKRSVPESMDFPRIHHQLVPNSITVEEGFPSKIEKGLKKKGHTIQTSGSSVVQTIQVFDHSIVASSDYRKGGAPSGF